MKVYILALLSLASCVESPKNELKIPVKHIIKKAEPVKASISEKLSVTIIKGKYGGYGFQIIQGNSPIIIQPNIPAIQGVKEFETEEQAAIIGNFMLYKMNNGIMPPSVSKHDLDSLGIIYTKPNELRGVKLR